MNCLIIEGSVLRLSLYELLLTGLDSRFKVKKASSLLGFNRTDEHFDLIICGMAVSDLSIQDALNHAASLFPKSKVAFFADRSTPVGVLDTMTKRGYLHLPAELPIQELWSHLAQYIGRRTNTGPSLDRIRRPA